MSYSIESEINKAFPYLDKLEEEIINLKKISDKNTPKQALQIVPKKKFILFRIFKPQRNKNLKIIEENKTQTKETLKHHKFIKDGYEFHIRIVKVQFSISKTIDHYEFIVSIHYNGQTKKNQFYKEFINRNDALQYYKNMEGVFKHLTRRDLMEKLFKEKKQEIEYYKKSIS